VYRVRVRVFVVAAVLTIAACSDTSGGGNGETSAPPRQPTTTLTIAGSPERVTDVAALALTDEQVKAIEKECKEGSGVPGDDGCKKAMEAIPRRICPPRDLCILFARPIGKPDLAVLQVRDQRPGSPVCKGRKTTLCRGIKVSSAVVTSVSPTRTSRPTSDGTSTPTSTSPSGSPVETASSDADTTSSDESTSTTP
jgi:hypothetical protein